MKERLKKNKNLIILWAVLCCLFLGSAGVLYKIYVRNAASLPRSVISVEAETHYGQAAKDIVLQPGESVTQEITMVSSKITGLGLWINRADEESQEEVEIQMMDQNGTVIQTWNIKNEEIPSNGFCYVYLPEMKTETGTSYILQIKNNLESRSNIILKKVNLRNYKGNQPFLHSIQDAESIKNTEGETENYSLSYQILNGDCGSVAYFYWFVVLVILSCVTLLMIGQILQVKKERMFVGIIFMVGCLYLLLLPPYAVPDEAAHFVTAYSQSSFLLGREIVNEENQVILEKESADFMTREETPSRSAYAHYVRGLTGKEEAVAQNSVPSRSPLSSNHLGYVPQMLGISWGRILHMNGVQIFFLGGLFALIWYCFVMWIGFRVIPEFAKNVLFVVGSLPMTLQMVASYNYDSVLLGAVFLFTAYILYLAYGEQKETITWKDDMVILALLIIIVPIKFVYLPLLGLGLLIPKEKFGSMKKKCLFGGGALAVGGLVMLFTKLSKMLVAASSASAGGNTTQTYTLAMCMKDPLHICVVFFETIRQYLSAYFIGMIGNALGWLELEVPMVLIIGYVVVLILCMLQMENRLHKWKVWERVWMGILVLGIFFIVCLGLLLDWTSSTSLVVLGVQGRYFLPICIPLVLIFQNSVIVLKRNLDKVVMDSMVVLQLLTVLSVMITIILR